MKTKEQEVEKTENKINKLKKQIERFDNNTMIKIRIHGIVKQKVTKIIETPIEKVLSVNEYLFRDKKLEKDFVESIFKQFPKGSIINIEEIKNENKRTRS